MVAPPVPRKFEREGEEVETTADLRNVSVLCEVGRTARALAVKSSSPPPCSGL